MKQLKLFSLGLVSAFALLSAAPQAYAADIYRGEGSIKDTGPVDYAPPITWTGFYIGGNLGAAVFDKNAFDSDDTKFIGGGHLGYNWQGPSNVVLGIEGDGDFADGFDYLASVRGRLGYSFGPTLLYGTGGAAFVGLNGDADDFVDTTGWVAGGGLEYKLRDNWSLGAEGLYYSFGADEPFDDLDFWVARARLTYHFGGRY